jgi:hypothetical protein
MDEITTPDTEYTELIVMRDLSASAGFALQ